VLLNRYFSSTHNNGHCVVLSFSIRSTHQYYAFSSREGAPINNNATSIAGARSIKTRFVNTHIINFRHFDTLRIRMNGIHSSSCRFINSQHQQEVSTEYLPLNNIFCHSGMYSFRRSLTSSPSSLYLLPLTNCRNFHRLFVVVVVSNQFLRFLLPVLCCSN
jgi:hypothetical protein